MMFLKRKPQIDTKTIFDKILNFKNNDIEIFNKFEMDFLQTPSSENISLFHDYLYELKSYKKNTFFNSFIRIIRIINTVKDQETHLKVKIFAQKLFNHCVENINMNPIGEKNILDNVNFFFFAFTICDKLDMHENFKIKILKQQEKYSKEVSEPFFKHLRIIHFKEGLYYA